MAETTQTNDPFLSLAEMQERCSMDDMMNKMISDFAEAESNGFEGDFEDFQKAGEIHL